VRTVEDRVSASGEILGTKVGDKVLSTDSDTLFPLRAALGYDITQSLFVGENTLLVEGPSDLLYIQWASNSLKALGREGLDSRWTITPTGGIDKVASFVTLFGGSNLHVAVLTDFHAGDKAKVRSLRESELLRSGHVFSVEMYTGEPEGDIEDLLGGPLYVALVNKTYGLSGATELPSPPAEEKPVLKYTQERFQTMPPDVANFDHFAPSAYLIEHVDEFEKAYGVTEALDRFEAFFKEVNALLP
jgi:hypothetical protein